MQTAEPERRGRWSRLLELRRAQPAEPALPDAERAIADALRRLRDLTAREVMTPRVDVVALEAPVTPEEVARAVRESGHSRFPVYTETLDQLEGVLFVKDLFRMEEVTTESISRRLRRPFLVPESRAVLELLQEMRQRRIAFAVAVDEHGGIEGVLTIKDLVSELVGDLRDEFDRADDVDISRIDATRWLVDGGCSADEAAAALGLPIPEGDYVTVGGFLFDQLGRIPEEGEVLNFDGFEFRVQEMDRRRIAKVVVRAPSATIGLPVDQMGDNGK